MSQRVVTQLVDDTDGTVLDEGSGETVSFALDGTSYTIDLTNAHADEFRGLFQDYIAVATRVGRRRTVGNLKKATEPKPAEVRAWALDNGHDLPARGRIPGEVRAAYDAAH